MAVAQLRFGDNDTLSAQVATLVEADWLFLLTDVDALYTGNPSTDPTATPVHEVDDVHDLAVDTAEAGTQWGTGGMATKLTAAGIATAAGCRMVICHFNNPSVIVDIIGGESDVGTVFHPISDPLKCVTGLGLGGGRAGWGRDWGVGDSVSKGAQVADFATLPTLAALDLESSHSPP